MKPFFSIVIPVYNRRNFIVRTIDSVLNQTFLNFEIIVVDDGSTDNSKELILNKYSNESRIKYFFKLNEERGAARNFGFKLATGTFVVFLDSDDIYLNNHLQVLYNYVSKLSNINFIATKFDFLCNGVLKKSELSNLQEGFYTVDLLLKGNPFACNFAVRKSNANLKLFNEDREYSCVEDWIFLIDNLVNDKIFLADFSTVIMDDHDQRSMRGMQDKIIRARLLSTNLLFNKYKFNKKQYKILFGHSYLFCSIHSYIDNNRLMSLNYFFKSIYLLGFKLKDLIFLFKILVGKKFINALLSFNFKREF